MDDVGTRFSWNNMQPVWRDLTRLRVGVLDLRSRVPREHLDTETLTDILVTHFVTLGAFRVVERERIGPLAPEVTFHPGELGAGESVPVGPAGGVDKLIAGSVSRIGDTYVVLVRGIDARTGIIEIGDQISGRTVDELLEALPVLADRLVRKARGERLPTFQPPGGLRRQRSGLEGDYELVGTNGDGSYYRGLVQIRGNGGGYRVLWRIGEEEYQGTGLRIGDRLTVSWGGGRPITYRILDDGTLDGSWDEGDGSETLTPLRD